MGSCMSSETKKPKTPKGGAKSPKDSTTTTTQERDPFFRNPPPPLPPLPEEEKVKEVLSETPKRTSSFITRQIAQKQQQQHLSTFSKQTDQKIQINGGNGDKKQHQIGKISTPEKNADQPEVSQTTTTRGDEESVDVSETVSMSESGVSMPATDDGNPDEVLQVQSRRKKRSGSGSFSDINRDSHSRRNPSPSRRQEPSPARSGRTAAAPRSVNGSPATERKGSFRRNGELGPKNNGTGTRRSRSPATRVDSSGPVNRTNSSRNMKSPSRNPLPGGKNQSANGPKAGEKEEGRMQDGSALPRPGGGGANNESLENPLVSLECFIFL